MGRSPPRRLRETVLTSASNTAGPTAEGAATPLPTATRMKIFAYCGALLFLQGLADPHGGLVGLPLNFVLKNKLHLQAHETAAFDLITYLPVYLGFLFGFARDNINPLGRRDRGFIIIFGAVGVGLAAAAAFLPISFASMLVGILLLTCALQFISSAQNGLMSTLAGQHAMSGQTSAVQNLFISGVTVVTMLAGGVLSDRLERMGANGAVRALYLVGAGTMGAILLFGLMRPRSVYDNVHGEHPPRADPLKEIGRLLRYRPIYPALLIWLLWNFNPGAMTPLLYHLQNRFHATDDQWAQYQAIQYVAFLPTYVFYGWLCTRFRLRPILWWSTLVAIPQYVCLVFIGSVNDAYIASAFIGLLGGVATGAYLDLVIRSCPHGLQGTVLMLSTALLNIAQRVGDVLGAYLYERSGGFMTCVIAVTVVYILILPALLLVKRDVADSADGEVVPARA